MVNKNWKPLALAWALTLLGACSTVELVASYDEATDRGVTALQKATETHFVSLERDQTAPKCTHDQHKKFYEAATVDLSSLIVRAGALPLNERSEERLRLLDDNLKTLEALHRISCLGTAQLIPLRTLFNSNFTAILKAELAKKRGEK